MMELQVPDTRQVHLGLQTGAQGGGEIREKGADWSLWGVDPNTQLRTGSLKSSVGVEMGFWGLLGG